MDETYVVVHEGGALEEDDRVVRELEAVDVFAVFFDVAAVKDVVILVHEAHFPHPVPRLLGPVGIGVVAGVASESCADVKEAAVCNA